MAAPTPNNMPINPDTTLITVKVAIDSTNRRFKIPLRDLGANSFPDKLRTLLAIPSDSRVTFERYSDSAASYVTLDSGNPAIYKQLYRAAKAKLKLRIKATVTPAMSKQNGIKMNPEVLKSLGDMAGVGRPRSNYLETVLEPSIAPRAANQTSMKTSLPNVTTDTLVAPPKFEDSDCTSSCRAESLSKPCLPTFHDFPSTVFCIDCNNCGSSIPKEHYHCSICDDGDFDLCMDCVENNVLCGGDGHWLIKRTLQNGRVISSVTETIAPKKPKALEPEPVEPVSAVHEYVVERTCNSCIGEFANHELVSCVDCRDFDLCFTCFVGGLHGHNPAHAFIKHEEKGSSANSYPPINELCKPGRNMQHWAICDGCDKHIVGVRHKCLSCPDWDYCSDCFIAADRNHPGHRFAPLYEPIADANPSHEVHYGIYCDGPLCENKPRSRSYIRGIRYKCAVCHDTDFCANCEALPTHSHDNTHPLIKFKTPVKHASVTTFAENPAGERVTTMGDRSPRSPRMARGHMYTAPRQTRTAATETVPVAKSTNAATQVQTMADLKPVPSEPFVEPLKAAQLEALFVCDSVPDGTALPPNTTFEQIWTLTNPGPASWPVGCSVRYIGGDSLLNLDPHHATSTDEVANASESNALEAPVNAGESADFKVTMKTLPREGRVISYWRLKSPEGVPFGHKLWCDISIRSPTVPEVKSESSYAAPSVKDEQDDESIKAEESSTMIFPKLEKESPVSSMHEEAKIDEATPPATESAPKSVTDDLLEDVESLELDDEQTDDGFLTDEEYDILDASDEEFLTEAQKAVRQK